MRNIFQKATAEVKSIIRNQTVAEIVEEIHETFYTEVDRLLHEAGISVEKSEFKKDLIEKGKTLRSLGFGSCKEAEASKLEETSLKENQITINAIRYFSQKYPQYKFITESSVRRICDKYGLVYGTVNNYTGTVPDANVEHLKNFKVDEKDRMYIKYTRFYNVSWDIDYADFKMDTTPEDNGYPRLDLFHHYREAGLEICAPVKDFDMRGKELRGNKVVDIPDPVVICPVMFHKTKFYLIITAWGPEASDELVVNQKMN